MRKRRPPRHAMSPARFSIVLTALILVGAGIMPLVTTMPAAAIALPQSPVTLPPDFMGMVIRDPW
ncbi:MAG: hypothetical protein J7463_18285, partial [Roseiflexus sp.]|nr:hypothetical protein [Roseiflexus sp.]